MPSSVIEEFMIIIAVVLIGLVLFGLTMTYFLPHELFSIAQQQASSLSSTSTLSVGPLLVSKNSGSAVIELYNPSVSLNVSILVFAVPSYLEQDVGIISPTSTPLFSVYLPNGQLAKTVNINSPIYDIGGRIIYDTPITIYTIPVNEPVTVTVNNVNSNSILIIWILYYSNGYWFRIDYGFTGVPSS
ncbi:hypothetical protein [Saccharolobus caldissimus]|uniref:Uncharacterized protein n=1 Tax=Saccharolobus caldissimus TaxID=1702097 RepID=A0AAQ4CTJ3_9CREN|nr:hypothetical protein [Saccharolobus caldissimus]BDB99124.1 hypothetical protein SACC_21410 [Saccharolobus caldissimus]